jgi:PIN domain nuclease of toxin-antitoxin system
MAVLLLDTHVLLWLDRDDTSLGAKARAAIRSAWEGGAVAVSSISFWEAAMLQQRGRIQLPSSATRWRADWLEAGLRELPLDGTIALAAAELADFHADPADRFIAATALLHPAQLMTADGAILRWSSPLLRLDARQ